MGNVWGVSIVWAVVAIAAAPAWAETVKAKTQEDYWRAAGMNLAFVKKVLATEGCTSTQAKFVGCVKAVDYLASFADLHLATRAMIKAEPARYGEISKTYGPLALVKRGYSGDDKLTAFQGWLRAKVRREVQLVSLGKIFKAGRAGTIPFSELLDFIAPLFNDDTPSWGAATAINQYYATSVDPHTYIEATADWEDEKRGAVESYVGIGAFVAQDGGRTIIRQITEDGPAHRAGAKTGDILVSVGGVPLQGKSLDEVLALTRGVARTKVALALLRKGKTVNVTVTRAEIVEENVTSKLLVESGVRYGYVRLRGFDDTSSCMNLSAAIAQVSAQGAKALVFDLRGNIGGSTTIALCVAGLFLGPGRPVYQTKELGKRDMVMESSPEKSFPGTKLPMVTLIDADSASASEIVAGALQDFERSWIAGARSYGKGTVQYLVPWELGGKKVPGVTIHQTRMQFFQPTGHSNQTVGIIPDIAVDAKPEMTDDERFAYREAELFPNAFPPIGRTWVQPRPDDLKRIETCLRKSGQALQGLARLADSAIAPDYQLLVAQDILTCDLK